MKKKSENCFTLCSFKLFFSQKSWHVCTSWAVEAMLGQKSRRWLIRHKFPLFRIPKITGFWIQCHSIIKSCLSEMSQNESVDPVESSLSFHANLASQIVHFKRFFFSYCTDAICLFKCPFCFLCKACITYDFIPSCTTTICLFKFPIEWKFVPQIVHLNGFFFLRELMQCAYSFLHFMQSMHHICCTWKALFLHELMQCAHSSAPFL